LAANQSADCAESAVISHACRLAEKTANEPDRVTVAGVTVAGVMVAGVMVAGVMVAGVMVAGIERCSVG